MNKMIKWLGNYWLTGIALIMFAISICINFTKIEDSNSGLIFGFVGILATFIVVGNYAQVMTIKSDFEKQIKENEKNYNEQHYEAIKKMNILMKALEEQQVIHEKNFIDLELRTKGALLQLQANNYFQRQNFISAFSDYLGAATFYNNSGEIINLEQILMQINRVLRVLSIEEIEIVNNKFNHNIYSLLKEVNNESLESIISDIRRTISSLPKTITEKEERINKIQFGSEIQKNK